MKVTRPVVAIPVTGSRGAVIGGTCEDERTGHVGDPGGTGPTSQNVTGAPASGPVVPLSVAVSLVTDGGADDRRRRRDRGRGRHGRCRLADHHVLVRVGTFRLGGRLVVGVSRVLGDPVVVTRHRRRERLLTGCGGTGGRIDRGA